MYIRVLVLEDMIMIRREDLVDIGDDNFNKRRNEVMRCLKCDEIMGGTRGDYWQHDMEYIFHCTECGSEDIALVVPVTEYKIIKV